MLGGFRENKKTSSYLHSQHQKKNKNKTCVKIKNCPLSLLYRYLCSSSISNSQSARVGIMCLI